MLTIRLTPEADLSNNSCLKSLRPFLDAHGLIRVGGRICNAELAYSTKHPIVLHGKHPITHLILESEHQRMMHAGPNLLCASICLRFHIISLRKTVRSVTKRCVTCRRYSKRVSSQQLVNFHLNVLIPEQYFRELVWTMLDPLISNMVPSESRLL